MQISDYGGIKKGIICKESGGQFGGDRNDYVGSWLNSFIKTQ